MVVLQARHLLDVFVPSTERFAATIAPGAGIVGVLAEARDGMVLIHYEEPSPAANIKTWADRCYHAAGRYVESYATHKMQACPPSGLIRVGSFHYENRVLAIEPAMLEALAVWIGRDKDLMLQSRVTSGVGGSTLTQELDGIARAFGDKLGGAS